MVLFAVGRVSHGRYNEVVEENEKLCQERAALGFSVVALTGELILAEEQVAQLEREQQEFADEMARWQVG